MSTQQLSRGEIMNFTAAGAIASGDVVQFGQVVGIAQGAASTGQQVRVAVTGVHSCPKVSAQAWDTLGALVYWTGTAMTTVASGNTPAGVVAAVAANPSSTGAVRLHGSFSPDAA